MSTIDSWAGLLSVSAGLFTFAGLALWLWRRFFKALEVDDDFDYEFGVAVAMANEARWVKEWLCWHREQGVDHFFIYDNDQWENDYEELFGVDLLPYVTVQPWKEVEPRGRRGKLTPQRQAYNHCMRHFAPSCRYLLVVDMDEFLMPAPGSPHLRARDALGDLPNETARVEIVRRDYGWRPHEKRPQGGVVENYVWRREGLPRLGVKNLISGAVARHLSWSKSVHRPRWVRSVSRRDQRRWTTVVDNERRFRINHYYTKSPEDWEERGRFWEDRTFNKGNGARMRWDVQPLEKYNEVKDPHAREIKNQLSRSFEDVPSAG